MADINNKNKTKVIVLDSKILAEEEIYKHTEQLKNEGGDILFMIPKTDKPIKIIYEGEIVFRKKFIETDNHTYVYMKNPIGINDKERVQAYWDSIERFHKFK